ncbi:MAG: TIGR04282 family arsenosugar biosynthesis glycosyltransferase [bacterium]
MIFAKAPEPGQVKTRLVPALGVEGAARLHAALLADVAERHQRPGRVVTLWRAGDLAHPIWTTLGLPLATQPDGDLGDRQRAAFAAEGADGAAVVVIGTDSPTLPPALVDAAFAALARVPVVIGPATDGGYYLLGLRGLLPPLFTGVAWGTDAVLPHLLETLHALRISFEVLDFWYDIDRPADLRLLRALAPTLAHPRPWRTLAALEQLP